MFIMDKVGCVLYYHIKYNVILYVKMTAADDARCRYRALGHHGRTRRNVSWKTA